MPKNYTEENLTAALSDINSQHLSIYKASRLYNIPRQTLVDKINKKYTKQDRPGASTVLTADEEKLIVQWVLQMAEWGLPVTKSQLLFSVGQLVKELRRKNTFKDRTPGKKWYMGFLSRHPIISQRVSQTLTAGRAGVTEEKLRGWFSRVHKYLEDHDMLDILLDPSRVFNCDESAFFLSPKGAGVLARKGSKTVYTASGNDEKENLTLSFGASADGTLMPIFVLFAYRRMPGNLVNLYPRDWVVGKSDNGWMTCQTFFEYIANHFHPFLIKNKIKLPVLLFVDGHSSHLSLPLSEFCRDHGIVLIALLPNSTHVLQPMDVAVFHPLKTLWKKCVESWRMQNDGKRLQRDQFGPLLQDCISQLNGVTIRNGFRACGLYPFSADAPNYGRLIKTAKSDIRVDAIEEVTIATADPAPPTFLQQFEQSMCPQKLNAFRDCTDGTWTGDLRDESLFYLWRKIQGKPMNDMSLGIDLNISADVLEANFLDNSSELNVSHLLSIENNSLLEARVRQDGSLATSTPQSQINAAENVDSIQEARNAAHSPISSTPGTSKQMEPKTLFPSPFKKALLWPQQTSTSKKTKNRKRVIPTVVTANDFIEHQKQIEDQKKKKLEKSLERQKRKEMNDAKKILTQNKKERKRKPHKTTPNNCKQSTSKNVSNIGLENDPIVVDDYVLVLYEGEKFPGVVIEKICSKKNAKYKVKTMQMSGANWKWPDRDDILIYESCDVIKKLKPPTLNNNRGVYSFENFT